VLSPHWGAGGVVGVLGSAVVEDGGGAGVVFGLGL
jgi:hypothetical protein